MAIDLSNKKKRSEAISSANEIINHFLERMIIYDEFQDLAEYMGDPGEIQQTADKVDELKRDASILIRKFDIIQMIPDKRGNVKRLKFVITDFFEIYHQAINKITRYSPEINKIIDEYNGYDIDKIDDIDLDLDL